jgi:D-3-phosphoglycerate dehydrogenase
MKERSSILDTTAENGRQANVLRVLASDPLAEAGLALLQAAPNVQVDVRTDLSPEELLQIIPAYDALLVRSGTRVTEDVLRAGMRLQVVARAGVGVDNIDIDAATRAGIIVVNAPTGNVVAAAEHTIAMLMALARHIPQADQHIREGKWQRSRFVGVEVRDKILGTVGLGHVAQEVVKRAHGLGMHAIAYDPYVTADFAAQRGAELVDLDTLLERSDFVTLHVPLTEATRHMINRDRLQRMKQGARLLNVSRGGVVDEEALCQAIESGRLAGAALDVFEDEPLPPDSPLRRYPQIILTPHLGGSTVEAQEKVAADVAEQVLDVLSGRPARYAVNAPIIPPKEMDVLIPFIDLAERMGHFLRQLDGQGIERLEITAHGPLANHDLTYVTAAAIKGILTGVVDSRVNLVNAILLANQRGIGVMERKQVHHHERYENMLTLRAITGFQERMVRGSVLQGVPTIVAVDQLWVDFPAEGHLLLTSHQDKPGIIGRIGTLLGRSDINISFMHVGRRSPRGEAIMVLGTDEAITPDIAADLNQIPDINWLKAVTL